MRIGQLVMLISIEDGMELLRMGMIGEIVEVFDGEDYGVDFPGIVCPAGPEPYYYVAPHMLMPINDTQARQIMAVEEK